MNMTEFFIIYGLCLLTMLICRCVPIFVLKGHDISQGVQDALNLIPPAAFAALVANDLLNPGMFSAGLWPGMLPLVAALIVLIVARTTKSLIWCVLVGVVAYTLLLIV